ncbi:MAG: protein-glutamate O-methyltransferase CheR [Proteobacteria bacterium]|nr:protein-glutamate O-methyltransferase CheR [Pseudomonadota bacterium]
MKLSISTNEFLLIRDIIHEKTGIFLAENKKYLIETRLSHLVNESHCKSFTDYYFKIKEAKRTSPLITDLVDAITTNETLWFRDTHPFSILEKKIFPELNEGLQSGENKKIHIWSAACSTGQEPYSIAMLALELSGRLQFSQTFYEHVKVFATDVSTRALSIAESGKFDSIAIGRGLPSYYIDKYFTKEDNAWTISPEVRQMIKFKNFNLKEPVAGIMGPFDVIFIRNVMIYFSENFKKELFRRIESVLKPSGFLILGTGESVTSYSERFDMINFEGSICYRLTL